MGCRLQFLVIDGRRLYVYAFWLELKHLRKYLSWNQGQKCDKFKHCSLEIHSLSWSFPPVRYSQHLLRNVRSSKFVFSHCIWAKMGFFYICWPYHHRLQNQHWLVCQFRPGPTVCERQPLYNFPLGWIKYFLIQSFNLNQVTKRSKAQPGTNRGEESVRQNTNTNKGLKGIIVPQILGAPGKPSRSSHTSIQCCDFTLMCWRGLSIPMILRAVVSGALAPGRVSHGKLVSG